MRDEINNAEPLLDNTRRNGSLEKLKNQLLRTLVDLTVLCNLDIACVILDTGKPLMEYSSVGDAGQLMDRFRASASEQTHEKHNPASLMQKIYRDHAHPLVVSRKRTRDEDAPIGSTLEDPPNQQHISDKGEEGMAPPPHPPPIHTAQTRLPPSGFLSFSQFPLSPRSEQSYKSLTAQFDTWISQLNTRGGVKGGGLPAEGSRLKSKGLSISVPHSSTQFQPLGLLPTFPHHNPLSLPHGQHLSSLLPPPAPLIINETNSGSGGKPLNSNSGLFDGSNIFGATSQPSPNASHLLDGMFSIRPSIGILGLDLPTPHSALKKDGNGGPAEVQWPGQEGENDDGDEGDEVRPGIDLLVQGRAIDLGREKILAASDLELPDVSVPPQLLTPSADLGGSLMMGISGVAVGTSNDKDNIPSIPFPGFK